MEIEERIAALERDNTENKRKLAVLEGSFQFIVGQLRDIQVHMLERFDAIDARFHRMANRFDRIDATLEAMPRALLEAMKDER